jgi:hypothetical protein
MPKTNKVVLILSNGVTASRDSVTPAPNPAITVLGPDIFPFESCSNALYWSNATNPNFLSASSLEKRWKLGDVLMPAFSEFPIINVVHPAYQALPNGGHGSFAASGNLRFNCVLVFATEPSTHQPSSLSRNPTIYSPGSPVRKISEKAWESEDTLRIYIHSAG